MLKLGGFGKKPAAPAPESPVPTVEEEEIPVEEPEAPVEEGLSDEMSEMGDRPKVNKALVVYMGGEFGPFRCDRCQFFVGDGSCQMVEGDIDPAGCCDIFTPPDDSANASVVKEEPSVDVPEDAVEEELPEEDAY
jgi:hypothetical protein